MYKTVAGFCFTHVFYVTALGFVGRSCPFFNLLYCFDSSVFWTVFVSIVRIGFVKIQFATPTFEKDPPPSLGCMSLVGPTTMRIQICHLNDQTFLAWTEKKSDGGCVASASSGTPSSPRHFLVDGRQNMSSSYRKTGPRGHQFVPFSQTPGLMRCYLLPTRSKRPGVDGPH